MNHYYPFGMSFAEVSNAEQEKQPYKYNGKELDRLDGLNWYDYSARQYEPALGRFTTLDPLAEKYYSVSPYAYCGNNPISRMDPTGCDWIQDRFGGYLWDNKATDQESTRSGWNYVGKDLPSHIDASSSYKVLTEIDGSLYHKNSSNPLVKLANSLFGTS